MEFQPAETVHVKAPPQKVIINTPAPAPAPEQAVVPQAVYAQATPAPMMQALAPAAVPMAATAFSAAGPASIQTVSANRARLALGFDSIRIPIPILRFYAVPTTQEITMPVQQSLVQTQAVQAQYLPVQPAQAQFAVQAQAAPVQMVPVQAQSAPAQLVPVQAQAQTQLVPVQAQAQMVPVQAQSVPAQMVPVQAQAMQLVPVQAQAAPAQMVPVQAQAVQMIPACSPCPPCPSYPQCPAQGTLTQQKLDEYSRQVESLKEMVKERYPSCSPAPCSSAPCDPLCNPPPPPPCGVGGRQR